MLNVKIFQKNLGDHFLFPYVANSVCTFKICGIFFSISGNEKDSNSTHLLNTKIYGIDKY